MTSPVNLDVVSAHRYFSANCFNQAWGLIDKTDRTPEENELLISTCHASIWHWRQRVDCTSQNLSIGYWQLSRVYSLLGEAKNARKYGEFCLVYSHSEAPFYLGYAYEALARAAAVEGDLETKQRYLEQGFATAQSVTDEVERDMLVKDLDSLRSMY